MWICFEMKLELKTCVYCKQSLPINFFNRNRLPGLRWAWCKECEKKYNFYENRKGKEFSHILSFSGGKDSTAMLLLMLEKKMRIDAVVYFDCGSFEFPQMAEHIEQVEKYTGMEIIKIKPEHDFGWLLSNNPNPGSKKQENGWPTSLMRWCTMMKINGIRRYMRLYRPYYLYIGYTVDEVERINKAADHSHNLIFSHKQINKYPLYDWNLSEKDCLNYCFKKGFHWNGLYKHFNRVSCFCCPLQRKEDLKKLYKYYPELYNQIKEWNKLTWNHFKNDPDIFNKIESEIRYGKDFTRSICRSKKSETTIK